MALNLRGKEQPLLHTIHQLTQSYCFQQPNKREQVASLQKGKVSWIFWLWLIKLASFTSLLLSFLVSRSLLVNLSITVHKDMLPTYERCNMMRKNRCFHCFRPQIQDTAALHSPVGCSIMKIIILLQAYPKEFQCCWYSSVERMPVGALLLISFGYVQP